MLVDFLKQECKTQTNFKLFGICDDLDLVVKTPAYIDFDNKENWIATVINKNNKNIIFTAIDHCVFKLDRNIDNPSRCDGMLEYENNIIFMELKDKSRAVTNADQLENTIKLANISKEDYFIKTAYLSNKRKKVSDYLHKDYKDEFLLKTNFRLFFTSEIVIE